MRIFLLFLLLSALPGCYESHTRAMDRSDEPVSVVVACDPSPDIAVRGGDELEAVACHVTPNRDVDYVGVPMNVAAEPRDSGFLAHGSAGTTYFTQFRQFVRGGAVLGPFEDSPEAGPSSQVTSLIGGPGSIRLRGGETADLVFAFTVATREDAPGELFSDGSSPTYSAIWFNWGSVGAGVTLGPNAFRVAGRPLRDGEVTGDISGPRSRRFSVTRP
jgi:hypothetical protein